MFGGGEPLPDSDCNGAGVVAARKFDLPSKVRPEIELDGCCSKLGAQAAPAAAPLPHDWLSAVAAVVYARPQFAASHTHTGTTDDLHQPAAPVRCTAPPLQLRTLAGPLVYVLVLSTMTAVYHALAAVSFWRMYLRSSGGGHAGHLVTRQCSHGMLSSSRAPCSAERHNTCL